MALIAVRKNLIWILLLTLAVLPAAAAQEPGAERIDKEHEVNSNPLSPVFQVDPDFELVDAEGKTVNMQDYRGRHLLVGFGFTQCTYVCPTMTANMAGALRELSASGVDATAIFISVDSERDSPETTHQYAQAFHKNMIGLSGSYAQLGLAAKNFRVNFVVTKTPIEYSVQHTANIYLIDPEGVFIDSFAINASAEELAAAVR